jgi:hypothetical protein
LHIFGDAEVRVPTVHRLAACKVQIFADDHFPPHFHLVGAGWRCSVEIASLTILAGKAPRRELEEAIEWARANRDLLAARWSELNERD